MPTPNRRFSLLDAVILIAATALGLAITRGLETLNLSSVISSTNIVFMVGANQSRTASGVLQDFWQREGTSPRLSYVGQRASYWLAPCLATWTLAVLALTAFHRAADRRRPGLMAGMAFLLAAACAALARPEMLLYYRARPGGPIFLDWSPWWLSLWLGLPRIAGLAVAAAWLSLGLGRCWQPDPGWLDRAGRLLGAAWIILGAVSLVSTWLSVLLL